VVGIVLVVVQVLLASIFVAIVLSVVAPPLYRARLWPRWAVHLTAALGITAQTVLLLIVVIVGVLHWRTAMTSGELAALPISTWARSASTCGAWPGFTGTRTTTTTSDNGHRKASPCSWPCAPPPERIPNYSERRRVGAAIFTAFRRVRDG
jgi:hypothetical protein